MSKNKKHQDLIIVGQEQPKAREALPEPVQAQMTFEAWWLITQRRLNLASSLKTALKAHMKSRGFLNSGRYDDGLKDFGIES